MDKKTLYIALAGPTNSGKTGIMKLLVNALRQTDIETVVNWGIDGPPMTPEDPNFEKKRLNAIANKSKVVITEYQVNRKAREPESILDAPGIQVVYDTTKGYGVRLFILGVPLEHWFGTFTVSKERARTIAARLAAELDVDVQDLIPREYEWVQPQ